MFDRERNGLIEVGEALHGPQWKRPLARDLARLMQRFDEFAHGWAGFG
jgi:hypothetical protein